MHRLSKVFLLIVTLTSSAVTAQQLDVKRIELKGDEVIVHYSLTDTVPGRTYSINLYSSLDNYVNPLTRVTGDFGIEVKPAVQRKIVWNAKQELGAAFDGKVAVEVRAKRFIPFIQFDSFSKIKKGKPTKVTWRGGTPQNILNFELWRNDKRVTVIPNIPNAQFATLEIPRSVKSGKNYSFRIVDSKNKDLAIQTTPFAVKPKVPLLVKVLPVAAVGAIIGLMGGGGDSGDQTIGEPPALPKRN